MNSQNENDEHVEEADENTTQAMDEWMNTWQEMDTSGTLPALREAFASAQSKRRTKDIVVLIIMLAVIGVCAVTVIGPAMLPAFVLASFGLVVATALTWKRYQRMRRERSSIPLSPREYLESSKHNLALMERENRLLRWISPLVLPAILAGNIWIAHNGWEIATASAGSLGIMVTLTVVLLGFAAWKTYVSKPRKLKAERDALEELESELQSE